MACCQRERRDAQARHQGRVKITHTDFATMLRDVECDVIAIGDYYSKRGGLALAALRARRHVLSDKPLCTSLAEQDQIERLAAERHLAWAFARQRDYAASRCRRLF